MPRIVFTLEDGVEIETELDADVITVGRHPESLVVLPSASVSSHHATIKRRGEEFFVQDLGTTNGTKLNGVEIEEAKLSDGDKVTFGDVSGDVHLTDAKPTAGPSRLKAPDLAPAAKPPVSPSLAKYERKRIKTPTYKEEPSGGCGGFLAFVFFLVVAFLVGLHLRHYSETQKVLIQEVWAKYGSKITGKAMKDIDQGTAAPSSDVPTAPSPTPPAAPTAPSSGIEAK